MSTKDKPTHKKADLNVVAFNNPEDLEEKEEETSEPDPHVVEFLELLLDQAKEGSITEVLVVTNYYNGTLQDGNFIGETDSPDGMVGALERLKMKYMLWADGIYFENEED